MSENEQEDESEHGYDEQEVILDDDLLRKRLHPAIDVVDNVLHIGMRVPIHSKGHIDRGTSIITSNKEIFSKHQSVLDRRDLFGIPTIVQPGPRWRSTDIRKFINSDENIDPQLVLESVLQLLKKYIEFRSEEDALIAALWTTGTYLQPVWDAYPYLSASGEKNVGKSRLMKVLTQVCFNGIHSASISAASVYRTIQDLRCTLLIDEAQKLASKDTAIEIRNILNCGYTKDAYAIRSDKTSKGQIRPGFWETFSPKAFVSYSGLEAVTEDRCIQIVLIRSINKAVMKPKIRTKDPEWFDIRDILYRFAMLHWQKVAKLYDEIDLEEFMGREEQLWQPLLTLAEYFDISERIRSFAKRKSEQKEQDQAIDSPTGIVLSAMVGKVDRDDYYDLPVIHSWIIESFHDAGESVPPFINHRWLGIVLKRRLGLEDKKRIQNIVKYRLRPSRIRDLCRRYNISEEKEDDSQQTLSPKTHDLNELSEQSELNEREARFKRISIELERRALERSIEID